MRASTRAPAHMGHGSIVTNSSQSPRRWLATVAPASRSATISAWAAGSESVMLRFHPRPTILPSQTPMAPTGTSFISRARWAQRRASSIQSSSVRRPSLVAGRWSLGIRDDDTLHGSLRKLRADRSIRRGSDHTEDISDDFGHDCADYCGNDYAGDWICNDQGGDYQEEPRLHG